MWSTKKKQRKAKKSARRAGADVENFGQHMKDAAEQGLAALTGTVVPAVNQGAKEAAAKAQDLVDQHLPTVKDAVQARADRASDLVDKMGPRAEKLRGDLAEDYLPRARRTAVATNSVAKSAVAAAVEAARKEIDNGRADVVAAATTSPKKKGRAGTVLLLLTLTAAGAAAGYVAWKRTRPVEDPSAPPADFARAHYPAAGSTDSDSAAVSDVVGGAEAGDVAQSLKADKGDHHGDVAPHDVKVDHASGSAAGAASSAPKAGTHRGEAKPASNAADRVPAETGEVQETGKVIDPVMNPSENPADPAKGDRR